MANCSTQNSEKSLVIETCKEVKLPGVCPESKLLPMFTTLCSSVAAGSVTVCVLVVTGPAGEVPIGAGIQITSATGSIVTAPGTVVTAASFGTGCCTPPGFGTSAVLLTLSQPLTGSITGSTLADFFGVRIVLSQPQLLVFGDLLSLFDSTQCGAPRFALIEVTNLGNCTVALFSVTSFATVPTFDGTSTAVLATVGIGSRPVALAPGVQGITLAQVEPGESVVLSSCDLVGLFSFCFNALRPVAITRVVEAGSAETLQQVQLVARQSSLPNFTANGCDFTFAIKAFFCVPGCSSTPSSSPAKNSTLTLVGS